MATIDSSDVDVATGDVARVSLGLAGDAVAPRVITEATGLEPSRAWEKGQPYPSRSGQNLTRPRGMWVVERCGSDVEQVALELLSAVEPRRQAILDAAAATHATVTVGIWWAPEGGQGGFSVSADVMKRLSELCVRVDVYFPG